MLGIGSANVAIKLIFKFKFMALSNFALLYSIFLPGLKGGRSGETGVCFWKALSNRGKSGESILKQAFAIHDFQGSVFQLRHFIE
jgi:hypothetical protein